MLLRYLVQTRQDKNDSGKLEAPPKKLCHKLILYVTTHHGRETKRTSCRHTPKPNSHSATNNDGELCVPDSDTSMPSS